MHRVDNATSANLLPTPKPVGPNPNGYFQNQTIVEEDFMNAVQEELAGFIEGQGLTLSKTDRTQLAQAILALVTAPAILAKLLTVDGSGSGLDADVLRGATPSETFSSSTIARRNASGHLLASYFQTTANFTTVPATSVMIETGSDGFIRRQTAAQFIANHSIHRGGGALVKNSINHSVPNTTNTVLTWDTDSYDTDNIHDVSTNTERLTVPSGVTKVRLSAHVNWDSNTVGFRTVRLFKNGGQSLDANGIRLGGSFRADSWYELGSASISLVSPVLEVVPGEYFTIDTYQNSGGTLTCLNFSWFSMEIMG